MKQQQSRASPKFLRTLTPQALQRIKDRIPPPQEMDERSDESVLTQENKTPGDLAFQSELEYSGYDKIENYDNKALNADVEGHGIPDKELKLKDRPSQND